MSRLGRPGLGAGMAGAGLGLVAVGLLVGGPGAQAPDPPATAVLTIASPAPSLASPGDPLTRIPRPGRPSQITLPSLAVQAPVVPVLLVDGGLTPPADPTSVGWWAEGALPGARRGSALLVGHTVHTGGGAFDHLDRLRTGEPIQLSTSAGLLRYAVRSVAVYHKEMLSTRAGQLFDQNVPGRLVLVTCGDWDGERYLSNVVVVADPA